MPMMCRPNWPKALSPSMASETGQASISATAKILVANPMGGLS